MHGWKKVLRPSCTQARPHNRLLHVHMVASTLTWVAETQARAPAGRNTRPAAAHAVRPLMRRMLKAASGGSGSRASHSAGRAWALPAALLGDTGPGESLWPATPSAGRKRDPAAAPACLQRWAPCPPGLPAHEGADAVAIAAGASHSSSLAITVQGRYASASKPWPCARLSYLLANRPDCRASHPPPPPRPPIQM